MHKIQYLRIILTKNCNLKCFFCHKEGTTSQISNSIDFEDAKKYISVFIACGIRKIKLMGGEPTLYPKLLELIDYIHQQNKSIDISLISNGIISEPILQQLIKSPIDRINISLHGYFEEDFRNITHGTKEQLDTVINTINVLKENGKLGKINYVLLKDVNQNEFLEVLKFISNNNIVLDILNYLGGDKIEIGKYFLDFEDIYNQITAIYKIAKEENYQNKYSITSKRLYLEKGGIINLKINKLSDFNFLNSCSNCSKKEFCKEGIAAIRLTTDGQIKPCLFRDDNRFDLKKIIMNKNFEETVELVDDYLKSL